MRVPGAQVVFMIPVFPRFKERATDRSHLPWCAGQVCDNATQCCCAEAQHDLPRDTRCGALHSFAHGLPFSGVTIEGCVCTAVDTLCSFSGMWIIESKWVIVGNK